MTSRKMNHYFMSYSTQVSKRGQRGKYKRGTVSRKQSAASRKRALEKGRVLQIPYGFPGGALSEMKSTTVGISTDASSTETITLLNGLTMGTAAIDNRIGRSIMMKSIEVFLRFTPKGANTGDHVLLSVVYDRQTNAATPAWTDVYNADDDKGFMRNVYSKRRFKVLHKALIPTPKAGADFPYVPHEFYRKLRHPVEYNSGNAGTVADITTGGLFLMYRAVAAAGADAVTVAGHCRTRYLDN